MIKENKKGLKNKLTVLADRWMVESYPGSQKRFELKLFFKDVGTYLLLPALAVFVFEALKSSGTTSKPRYSENKNQNQQQQQLKSQIISFVKENRTGSQSEYGNAVQKRAPGILVKLKLQNQIETYGSAPVHAQVIDDALGRNLLGSSVIGDATPDSNFERIYINFKFVRGANNNQMAVPISARALSLNGTLGIEAQKKEGFFARATFGSTNAVQQGAQAKVDAVNLNDIFLKALTSGFMNEFSNSAQVQNNRAQVLSISPGEVFFAELTDFFPGKR